MDLALNNQQRLICHKTQQIKSIVCWYTVKWFQELLYYSHNLTFVCTQFVGNFIFK